MMATDFLLNAHKPTDPSFQDIMQIKQNANRAASLVRQLLAFSRQQTLRPQVLDLGERLDDLTIMLRRLIGEKVTLEVEHGRDLWPVKADISQFEQVIVNLAVNARDAMPNGGKLTVRTAQRRRGRSRAAATTRACPPADYVLVEVADTGTGIPPEIIDKIFEPFFSTKEVGKGTGLGLSTVYGIVKQTGGFIYPDSDARQGHDLPHLPAAPRRRTLPTRRRHAWRRRSPPRRRPPHPPRQTRCRSPRPISPGRAPSCWSRTRRGCARSTPAGSPRAAIRCSRPATASRRSRCSSSTAARSISSCPTW